MEIIERIITLRLKACPGAIATNFSRDSAVLLTIVIRRQYYQRQLRQPQNHEQAQVSCWSQFLSIKNHPLKAKVKCTNVNSFLLLSCDLRTHLFLVDTMSSGTVFTPFFSHRSPHVLTLKAFTHWYVSVVDACMMSGEEKVSFSSLYL